MGDDSALERLYLTLRQRFLFVALNFFRDEHEAQTAFDEAFLKLQARLRDGFEWQGEPQLYRYFKTIIINECRDTSRKGKKRRDWEADHIVSLTQMNDNDTVVIEYVEFAIGCDPEVEEAQMRWSTRIQGEVERYLAELTPQDRRFLEAYQALDETPGSHEWGSHQRTAFLKEYLGLEESAFYPAHTRFKQKMARFAVRWGFLREEE